MEIALVCMLVGVGRLIGMKVDASEMVIGLKNLIKDADPEAIQRSAGLLRLYLGKRGGSGLKSDSEEVKAMRKGEIPDTIKELMQDHLRMDDADQLDDDECFGTNFQPGGREIHVLVKLPSAKQRFISFRSSTARTESRLQRWRELNEIYDDTKKSRADIYIEKCDGEGSESSDQTHSIGSSSSDSTSSITPSSRVGWRNVEDPVPDDTIDALATYLPSVNKATKGYLDMSVGVQLQLIGPVLITICNLFDDMKLDFDRTVTGNQVHARIQLDFVFKRGNKTKMCVAHAKRGDFEQARTHALVACEVIAEREDQRVVYGLVTDFLSWHLFRSGENSVAMDGRMMSIRSDELGTATLRDVCEMIYGALASHDEEDERDHQLAKDETKTT